jgi:hypothetical protein
MNSKKVDSTYLNAGAGTGKAYPGAYAELMVRIVPIGFQACDSAWRTASPADTPR